VEAGIETQAQTESKSAAEIRLRAESTRIGPYADRAARNRAASTRPHLEVWVVARGCACREGA
jgi:hypothetical protein